VKLFRQQQLDQWQPVVQRVAAALEAMISQRSQHNEMV